MSGHPSARRCGIPGWIDVVLGLLMMLPLSSACGRVPVVRTDIVDVHMVAQKRSWRASYIVASAEHGSIDVPTGREVHRPLGAGVHLTLASPDNISSFTVPDLELRQFALPSRPSRLTFFADRVGRYEVRGEEMCGLPHTERARGWLVVEPPDAFQAWVGKQIREARR